MKTITFDDSRWPLVLVRYGAQVDESEFDELLRRLDENVKRTATAGKKITLIYDSSSGYQASPRIRQRQAQWMKENAEVTRRNCVGIAFVINSSLVRGVLTAVLWLTDMPAPYCIVGTLREAEKWCDQQLKAHGFSVPKGASAWLG